MPSEVSCASPSSLGFLLLLALPVGGEPRSFKCKQPLPEFTLGPTSNPSDAEVAKLWMRTRLARARVRSAIWRGDRCLRWSQPLVARHDASSSMRDDSDEACQGVRQGIHRGLFHHGSQPSREEAVDPPGGEGRVVAGGHGTDGRVLRPHEGSPPALNSTTPLAGASGAVSPSRSSGPRSKRRFGRPIAELAGGPRFGRRLLASQSIAERLIASSLR
jgi:hypothetical protein